MGQDPYKYFRIEARELIEGLGKGVLELEKGAGGELVPRLLRLAHTLKGAARVVKQGEIAESAHAIEPPAKMTVRSGGPGTAASLAASTSASGLVIAVPASISLDDVEIGVAPITVYRDLERLAGAGLVERVHGGARAVGAGAPTIETSIKVSGSTAVTLIELPTCWNSRMTSRPPPDMSRPCPFPCHSIATSTRDPGVLRADRRGAILGGQR